MQTASAVLFWTILAILGAGGYYTSLLLHPRRTCPRCKGNGRHKGAVFTYAERRCRRCNGAGRLPRLGAKIRANWRSKHGKDPNWPNPA